MRRTFSIRLLLIALLMPMTTLPLMAQEAIPVSVRQLASDFGLRPQFLDDTLYIAAYIDSLDADNQTLTDACLGLNSRFSAMENVLMYDYRHTGDTVWIDGGHYLSDYNTYILRIKSMSVFVMRRANWYLEREQQRQNAIQQTALNLRKDTIERRDRTIRNACEGIGVNNKARKKELNEILLSYLSVYNRFDLSMRRTDSVYLSQLDEFSAFQESLIDNMLSSSNYSVKINNFSNTLKLRCGRNHNDIYKSYSRVFRQGPTPPQFTTIDEYNEYIAGLQDIVDIQNSYLNVIELRDKITATNKHIVSLYSPKFREVAKNYQEIASKLNTKPEFVTLSDARKFVGNMQEFIKVQECYVNDYIRLTRIQEESDSIIRRCSSRYSDVAKAYKHTRDVNAATPKYQTLDDAVRFGLEMDRFEALQRQYDTVIELRKQIDRVTDSISKGWTAHTTVYNGFKTIRKQYNFTPSFIDLLEGRQFVATLRDFIYMQRQCQRAINLYSRYKELDEQLVPALRPYRKMINAYNRLEKEYLTIKSINHASEVFSYCRQYEAFITVQETMLSSVRSGQAKAIEAQLKENKDPQKIELILGL